MLNLNQDRIKHVDCGTWNKDMGRAMNLPTSAMPSVHTQWEGTLEATEVPVVAAGSEVVSLRQDPEMDKANRPLLEWINGCTKCGVYLSYRSCFYYT